MEGNYLQVFAEKTPQRSAVKSSYIQKCASFGSTKKGLFMDDTTLHQAGDVTMSMMNEKSNASISGIFELESSKLSDTSYSTKGNFTRAIDETNTNTFLEVEDPENISNGLLEEFLDFFLSYSGEHEIFNLLLNYEEIICNQITKLVGIVKKSAANETRYLKPSNMMHFFRRERNLWRLMRSLFEDRIESKKVYDDDDMLMDTLVKRISAKEIAEIFFRRNSFVRQCQIIVDCLEKNAEDDFNDTFFEKLEYFSDHCVSWENTLHDLTTHNVGRLQMTGGLFTSEIDPDAPIRQKNSIFHEADKENESRLLKYMFFCIRAGDLTHAQQLAERFGQVWMAATLEGWRLHHDPNFNNNQSGDSNVLQEVEGNKYRDIWKAATWEMSAKGSVPIYEQAIYGCLSGNLKSTLRVCISWDDHLWAYLKSLVDKKIEEEIRNCTQFDKIMQELPAEYWDKILDLDQIFKEIEASDSELVKMEARSPLNVIQKYLILDDIDGLIEEMHSWLNNIPNPKTHTLRCMVHIILFLRVIGRSTKEELCVSIIEAYVQELIVAHKVALIAPYTSTLPKSKQIMWYAKFLESITDNTERKQCLQHAEDCGLDVPVITKTVVENIRRKDDNRPLSETATNLYAETTKEDEQKISAIDWLIFDPSQRAEAMKQANSLLRIFVAQKKIEAAKDLFSKIPVDSVAVMMQLAKMKDLAELSPEDDNSAREYLCFKAYLDAIEAFNDWFRHFAHSKPRAPSPPSGENVGFKDKVAYEHEEKQYQVDLERWNNVLNSLGSTATDCLYNVLLFVNGGWMVDQRREENPYEERLLQMSLLRKLCIPDITRLLQTVLFNQEKFKEAVQLADIIASEQYQLYKEFSTEDLQNFLSTTLESSLSLLDKNLDPLGYPYH